MRKTEEEQNARLVRCALGIVTGGIGALLFCLGFLLLAAVCMARGLIGDGVMYQVGVLSSILGAFAGGVLGVRRSGERALLTGAAVGLVLFLLLLTLGLLFFGAVSSGSGWIGLLCGCLCGGAASRLLPGGRKIKKGRHPKKKHRK